MSQNQADLPPDFSEPVNGENLLTLSSFQKRRIKNALMGMVYQYPHLGLRLEVSAGGNIAERLITAAWRHVGNMRQRATHLFEKTEIPVQRLDESPENFSGGMQQRVQIAKALSNNPMFLFLDEVSTGLDLSVQARVLDLFENPAAGISLIHGGGVPRSGGNQTPDRQDHGHERRPDSGIGAD